MPITIQTFGSATLYTISNPTNTFSFSCTNYGATLISIIVNSKDILLGYDTLEGYLSPTNPYFGATVGRVANRVANGTFKLNSKTYNVPQNNSPNMLHGGTVGFDKQHFTTTSVDELTDSVTFQYISPDGNQGFPGTCTTTITYSLPPNSTDVKITSCAAMSGSDCPVSIANHAYFNLAGHTAGREKLRSHKIFLNADRYNPTNSTSIPTGIKSVDNTPFDFFSAGEGGRQIGEKIDFLKDLPGSGGGYDHNFCLCREGEGLQLAAVVTCEEEGISLKVFTTAPGVQFYTGNYLGPSDPEVEGSAGPGLDQAVIEGKGGAKYERQGALCLEAQEWPDAINNESFPCCVVKDGEERVHEMVYSIIES